MKKPLLFILSCLLLSCEETTVSPSTPSSSVAGSDVDVILLMSVQNDPSTSVITQIYQPTCTFKSSSSSPTYSSLDAGAVSVNNITLMKMNMGGGGYTYQDSTNLISSFPMSWNITESTVFPALSFTDQGTSMPGFSNYSQLPDTINRSNGLTFVFSNLLNSDVTEFRVNPNMSSEISVVALNGVITLSPSQLADLPASNFSTISVKCNRTTPYYISANGKTIRFTSLSNYTKYGIVVQ